MPICPASRRFTRPVMLAALIVLGLVPGFVGSGGADSGNDPASAPPSPAETIGAETLVAGLDSLGTAEEALRAGLFTGAARHLEASARARARGLDILEEAALTPTLVRALPWPQRTRWLERCLLERRPDWGQALVDALDGDLPGRDSPSQGPAALAVALNALALTNPETPGHDRAYALQAERALMAAVARADFDLRDEALFRLYRLTLQRGDTLAALAHADSLVALDPPSPRSPEVRLLRARRLAASPDPESLGAAVREAQLAQPTADGVEVRWFLAELYRRMELPRAEALQLEGLMGSFGSTRRAAEAYRRRLELGRTIGALHVVRGQRIALLQELLGGRTEVGAEDSLLAWSGSSSIAEADRTEATRVLTRHYYRTRQYAKAEPILRGVIQRGNREDADQARLTLARIHRNTARPASMEPLYLELMESNSREAGNAVWEVAREMESLGRWEEADAYYTRLLDLYMRHPRRDEASFRRGFVRVRRQLLELAEADFHDAFAGTSDGADRERAAFWRARTLRALEREEEALRAAQAGMTSTNPRDYYGIRLREEFAGKTRTPSLVGPDLLIPEAPEVIADQGQWSPRALRAFRRGLHFARMGELARSRVEWKEAAASASTSPAGRSLLSALAQAAAIYDVYPEAVTWARKVQLELAPDDPRRDGYERLFYPAAYYGEVSRHAGENDLPPQLIWGVMRQESFYDPHAVSRAGARGLLQIMPATLDRMVREIGFREKSADALFRPDVNIELGTRFLRDRIDEFGGRLLPALASYNAGEGKSREWLDLAEGDGDDVFVESVGYPETYTYVRRITWLNWVYHTYYERRIGAPDPDWR